MASRYRLPEWLGGYEVGLISMVGEWWTVHILAGDHTGERLTVSRGHLVEVKPPSIDDPVELPLTFEETHEQYGLEIRRPHSDDPGLVGAVSVNRSRTRQLTAEECRDAARALWLLGNGGAS